MVEPDYSIMTPVEVVESLCSDARWKIKCAMREFKNMEKNYKACRIELFKLKNNLDPEDVIAKYITLAASCCTPNSTAVPCHHYNIKLCDKCLPTQIDKDAYFSIYGRHMRNPND